MSEIPMELKGLGLYETDTYLCDNLPRMLIEWTRRYPAINIVEIVKDCHIWELENPHRQKKNRIRFIGNWLRNERGTPPASRVPPEQVEMTLKTNQALEAKRSYEKASQQPGADEAKADFQSKMNQLRGRR